MSEKTITQAMMVADWNARHPEFAPVDLLLDGRKIHRHEVTTEGYAYLNGSQMATIRVNIKGDFNGSLEVPLGNIKPKEKGVKA